MLMPAWQNLLASSCAQQPPIASMDFAEDMSHLQAVHALNTGQTASPAFCTATCQLPHAVH